MKATREDRVTRGSSKKRSARGSRAAETQLKINLVALSLFSLFVLGCCVFTNLKMVVAQDTLEQFRNTQCIHANYLTYPQFNITLVTEEGSFLTSLCLGVELEFTHVQIFKTNVNV